MKKQHVFISLFVLSIIFISGCASSFRIVSDYETNTDFNTYSTYKILNHEHGFPVGTNRINQQRIERALEKEMANQDFQEVDNPDLELFWFVKVENVQEKEIYRNYYDRWAYNQFVRVYDYQEGTLVVDLIDRKTQQVVWHGKTSSAVYEGMPNIEEKINKAARAMFEQFAKDANRETISARQ